MGVPPSKYTYDYDLVLSRLDWDVTIAGEGSLALDCLIDYLLQEKTDMLHAVVTQQLVLCDIQKHATADSAAKAANGTPSPTASLV